MQVVVWIIIIMLIIFLIWLLRRWIRRLIFILILLLLAFFIYGIFNPSGAARLWYNVRTFPQRMASWMGSSEKFLDYDSYKSKITSIGDSIGDKIDSLDDGIEDFDLKDEIDVDVKYDGKEEKDEKEAMEKSVKNEDSSASEKQTIKSFPKSIKFVEFPELKEETNPEVIGQLTGYSKSDLLGVINKYIEENLDDYTDILVTVEYEDNNDVPQRIILETQSKSVGDGHSVYFVGSVDELLEKSDGEKVDNSVTSASAAVNSSNNYAQNNVQSAKKTTSNKLTQKDQQEAEEIFSILF